jgi:hypothetical protein
MDPATDAHPPEDAIDDRLGGSDVRVVRHPVRPEGMCANFETYTSSGAPYCNL